MGLRKQAYVISELECPVCGNRFTVPRKKGKQRAVGHIKDIWCPCCKATRKFIERGVW